MPGERLDASSHGVAVTVHGSARLFAARLLSILGVQIPSAAALLFAHQGLLALATFFIPLVAVQIPCRAEIVGEGLGIRWTCCETLIPFEALEAVTLGPDPRRWRLGRREPALSLVRRRNSKLVLLGELRELEALRAALETALAGRAAELSEARR